ncbi:MAG: tetratricopeptide repeat protein [Roseiarcus sp.]|jgi:predicted O-linked N-acetylglucosamine transferase (SPINDLY family)
MTAIGAIDLEIHLAVQALRQGDRAGAEQRLKAALRAQPRHPRALAVLGAFLAAEKRYREAEPILRAATRTPSASDATCFHYGLTLQNLDRPQEALEAFGKALAKNPRSADAWFGRGSVLLESGKPEEAIVQCDRAIALNPDYYRAYHDKGAALFMLRRYAEAALNQDACLRINPSFAPAHLVKAKALAALRQFGLALASVETAVSLAPGNGTAWYCRSGIFRELRRFDEAIVSVRKALSLDPSNKEWQDNLIRTKLEACDWSSYQSDLDELRNKLRSGAVVQPAFIVLFPFSAVEQLRAAVARHKASGLRSRRAPIAVSGDARPRIRIAYLSAELGNHPTAKVFVGVLEQHDKRRFEIIVLNNAPRDHSPEQDRVIDAADEFIDVFEIDDDRLVDLIKKKQIDILVNLDFGNELLRNQVFSRRPTPLQANYLGHPGTAAAPNCDYLIADTIVIPPESRQHYLEKVVYLPDSYLPNDSRREIAERPMRRGDMGLPEGAFVFCCFHYNSKLNPDTFDGWSRILLAVPDSVLWLRHDSVEVMRNLRKEAAARGVAGDRLVFAKLAPYAEHLARHRLADLFLDNLPYNGHATASEALCAGLPVLTRIGDTFAGRVGASLLTAVGLPELIVATQEEYEATAIGLAANPERLRALKEKLERNRPTAPLFDTKLYTARIEAAFEAMHARRLAGLPPEDIYVPA